MRWFVLWVTVILIVGGGIGAYFVYFRDPPPLAEAPRFQDEGNQLPTSAQFEELAHTDPVKLLSACLTRFQREVKNGISATLVKKERVRGEPKPPTDPAQEVIKLSVKGDVPDTEGKRKAHVRMIWEVACRDRLRHSFR
jgi:hypothetical protein